MIQVTFNCESVSQLRQQMMEFLSAKAQETFPVAPSFVEPHPKMAANKIANGVYNDNEAVKKSEQTSEISDTSKSETKPFALDVAPKAEPEKRKRRTKAEIEAEKAAKSPGGDVFQEPGAEDSIVDDIKEIKSQEIAPPLLNVSKETVHQALQQVTVAAGLPKAREILAAFKVNRISEIKEPDYKAFIEKCNEATMMA